MRNVVVVKLGAGNTASVVFALERLGVQAVLSDDVTRVAEAERLILPGVAAAGAAMAHIRSQGLEDVLRTFARPVLGICLGMQLLYEASEEGAADALKLLRGQVRKLGSSPQTPLPHMGWSRLEVLGEHALLDGIWTGDYAYFAHSYAAPVGAATIASATHEERFSAVAASRNLFGCQFHPERSGELGQRILSNFMSLPC